MISTDLSDLSADCEPFRAGIVAMIDGELEPAQVKAIEAHIADCESCISFRAEVSAVLQLTKDAFATPATAPLVAGAISGAPPPQAESGDLDLILGELRAVRAELQTMRAEISELRAQLSKARAQIAEMPARPPVARPIFAHAAPMDRLRSDR